MTPTIRAFTAVSLPNEVLDYMEGLIGTLQQQAGRRAVRWVRREAMHLTIRFLGNTAVSALPDIAEGMDRAAQSVKPFMLTLDRLGAFPNQQSPRVLWLGMAGNVKPLVLLGERMDEAIRPFVGPLERKQPHPHLTLGRVKEPEKVGRVRWQQAIPPLVVPVTAVALYQSDLTPTGPRYTLHHQSMLGQHGRKRPLINPPRRGK